MKTKLSGQDRGLLQRREGFLERRRAFIRQIEGYEEYKDINLVAQNNVTADDAVQCIKDKTMAALVAHGPTSRDGVGLVDYNVSLSVMELAQRLVPGQHGTLVEFMSKLQKETAIDPGTGEALKSDKDILWTDLPSFGYTELEGWYEYGGDHQDPCNPDFDPEQRERWVKLNAFLAQLTQAADVHYESPGETPCFHPLDKSLRATWVFEMAFENLEHSPEMLAHTATMEAACQWFIQAADRLWANVVNGRVFPQYIETRRDGSKGFERERWDRWARDLRRAEVACSYERMKKLIRDALAHIKRAMRGHRS
ncbi:hypothetical protein N7510_000189 [Penicillium lagena]|uniref:uncharacterized protein n=1 Tax=Penicillium lagena TaxID=94218 RepID=UPI0025411D92|nr:uncharacterized protein N7510_000189 [Penicillium lagena]KAJ5623880.1 hypothetical protein N7510_000189 [Penicillium lagena]